MNTPKYPEITVTIDPFGPSGNAFEIISNVIGYMKLFGVSKKEQDIYLDQATMLDYAHLLEVTKSTVHVVFVN